MKPWIKGETQKLMFYRDKFFRKMVKNPTSENKYLYFKFGNRVVSEQFKSKIKNCQNYLEKYKINIKMLWAGMKSVVNPIQAVWHNVQCPPPPLYRFLPSCAKTACSGLMKLSDFWHNFIGHHVKFTVTYGVANGNTFFKSGSLVKADQNQ